MSDCGCVYVEVDECCDVSCDTTRKARKNYKCYECGEPIAKGDNYKETTSLYDGRWSRHRTCVDCVSVKKHLYCSGYYYGAMWQGVEEHIDWCGAEMNYHAVAKLTPKAREKVCAMIEKHWEEIKDEDDD